VTLMPVRARGACVAFVMLAVCATSLSARRPSPLDTPVEGPFRLIGPRVRQDCTSWWPTAEQFAQKVHVRVGFETTPQCWLGGGGAHPFAPTLTFDGLSPREALDRLMEMRPEFAWREVDGVVVIRPVPAWMATGHVLQTRVGPFVVEGVHPHHALHTMLDSAQPSLLWPHTDLSLSSLGRRLFDPAATGLIDEPVTVRFTGGTVLQALNAVTEPFGGIWQIGYSGSFMHIVLSAPDSREGVTHIPVRISAGR